MASVRDMTRQDLDSVVKIIGSHHRLDGDSAAKYYHRYFSEVEITGSPREKNFAITEPEGRCVGVAGFCPDKYDGMRVLWLTWFYVAPDYRRRGIGAMLLRYVIGKVQELGARKLYVDTSSDQSYAKAVTMYERFGFREEGRLLDYYDDGEHCLILGVRLEDALDGKRPHE